MLTGVLHAASTTARVVAGVATAGRVANVGRGVASAGAAARTAAAVGAVGGCAPAIESARARVPPFAPHVLRPA